jgi:hypothetical protein
LFKNYLNSYNLNFDSHRWITLLNFLVLMCERDSWFLWFLNELNLTYWRLTGFMVSFNFISIVWVPWEKFHYVTLLSGLFRLSEIRSQSWLWVAWPRDYEVCIRQRIQDTIEDGDIIMFGSEVQDKIIVFVSCLIIMDKRE